MVESSEVIRPGIFAVYRDDRSGTSMEAETTLNPAISAISLVRSVPALSSARVGDW